MDRVFGRRNITMKALTDFSHLEKTVQNHLKNVYTCLLIGMLAAAAGAYAHLFTFFRSMGLLTILVSVGLLIWLSSTHHSPQTVPKRMAIFAGFAFCSGSSMGPLLDYVVHVNPSIIPTAFLASSVIFGALTMASLLNKNRGYLFLSGILGTSVMFLMMASLMNIFFRSSFLLDVNIYFGLVVFCGFVLFDTQLIVEKRRRGDDDYIWHSVDLFMDFIAILRRLMVILARKEDRKSRD